VRSSHSSFQPLAILGTLALFTLSACNGAGQSTMVFGTNTLVALDVSGDPATGNPHFTLGYKRQEAVWLPLALSGAGAEPTHLCGAVPGESLPSCLAKTDTVPGTHVCLTADSESSANATMGATHLLCTSVAEAAGAVFQGRRGDDGSHQDAYSVFASFGMKYESAQNGEIAQAFATGLAAQNLTQQGGAALINPKEKSPATAAAEAKLKQQTEMTYSKTTNCAFSGGTYNGAAMKSILDNSQGIPEPKRSAFLAREFENKAEFQDALDRAFFANLGNLDVAIDATQECEA